MHRHTEAQTLFSRRCGPGADDIAMGTNRGGIPRLMLRVPGVKAVMVIGQSDEYPGAGVFVARNQLLRLPVQAGSTARKAPCTQTATAAQVIELIFVLPLVLDIHVARVPVPGFGNALRTPVSPDAELGILVPIRRFVIEQ